MSESRLLRWVQQEEEEVKRGGEEAHRLALFDAEDEDFMVNHHPYPHCERDEEIPLKPSPRRSGGLVHLYQPRIVGWLR